MSTWGLLGAPVKSLNPSAYREFRSALAELRRERGLTQVELAKVLDRPQSYVSKVESGDKRLDVLEFILWMRALDAEPGPLISELADHVEKTLSRTKLLQGISKPAAKRPRVRL